MDHLPEIKVVAAALINEERQVLLAQRPLHKHLGGYWEFPGGKIEQGESKEHALIRELQEELSINIQQEDLVFLKKIDHKYPEFHLKMTVYALHKWQNEVQNNEHQALAWVSLDQMNDYPLPPADYELIAAFQSYLKAYKEKEKRQTLAECCA